LRHRATLTASDRL